MTVHGGWKDRSSDARKIGVFFPVDFSLLCELLLFWCLAVSIIDVPVRYTPRKREGEGFDVVFANWGKKSTQGFIITCEEGPPNANEQMFKRAR